MIAATGTGGMSANTVATTETTIAGIITATAIMGGTTAAITMIDTMIASAPQPA